MMSERCSRHTGIRERNQRLHRFCAQEGLDRDRVDKLVVQFNFNGQPPLRGDMVATLIDRQGERARQLVKPASVPGWVRCHWPSTHSARAGLTSCSAPNPSGDKWKAWRVTARMLSRLAKLVANSTTMRDPGTMMATASSIGTSTNRPLPSQTVRTRPLSSRNSQF